MLVSLTLVVQEVSCLCLTLLQEGVLLLLVYLTLVQEGVLLLLLVYLTLVLV